jgi:hypothetical protein
MMLPDKMSDNMSTNITSNSVKIRLPATPSNITPAFIRLPRAGQREPFSGLTRTQLFTFIKTGRVKSHSLKMPGCKRGVRLIDAISLRAAIQSFDNGQQTETSK